MSFHSSSPNGIVIAARQITLFFRSFVLTRERPHISSNWKSPRRRLLAGGFQKKAEAGKSPGNAGNDVKKSSSSGITGEVHEHHRN